MGERVRHLEGEQEKEFMVGLKTLNHNIVVVMVVFYYVDIMGYDKKIGDWKRNLAMQKHLQERKSRERETGYNGGILFVILCFSFSFALATNKISCFFLPLDQLVFWL